MTTLIDRYPNAKAWTGLRLIVLGTKPDQRELLPFAFAERFRPITAALGDPRTFAATFHAKWGKVLKYA
jgi:hypothetical protein